MKKQLHRWLGRLLLMAMVYVASTHALGGEFINLGFDDPDLTNAHYDEDRGVTVAPVLEVLRGWSVSPVPSELPYSGLIGVSPGVAPPFGLSPWIEGYAVGMNTRSFAAPGSPLRPTISIYQTGTVPSDAAALRYSESGGFGGMVPVEVYLSGVRQTISTPGVLDVSGAAGTDVILEFRFPGGLNYFFDVLGFVPVPEPTVWVLAMAGGAGLLLLRRRT